MARLMSTLVVSLMVIALYWKVAEQPYFITPTSKNLSGVNTVEIQNTLGAMFFLATMTFMGNFFPTLTVF